MSGFPIPEVSWRFGTNFYLDASIERYSLYSMSNSSFGEDTMVLEISMPRQSDTGSYTCVASSPYFDSVESEPALVLVQGNQTIAINTLSVSSLQICILFRGNHSFVWLIFSSTLF